MDKPNEQKSIQVQIGGMDLLLKSDEDPDYVKEIARFVEHKYEMLTSKTNVKSQAKISLLVALQIADELFQMKNKLLDSSNKLRALELRSQEIGEEVDAELSRILEIRK